MTTINKMDSQRLIDKYPDRVPIILRDTDLVDKKKYLVPIECTVAQFNYIIRKRIKNLSDEKAIFIFFKKDDDNSVLQSSTLPVGDVYARCASSDGFLYATLSEENTFG